MALFLRSLEFQHLSDIKCCVEYLRHIRGRSLGSFSLEYNQASPQCPASHGRVPTVAEVPMHAQAILSVLFSTSSCVSDEELQPAFEELSGAVVYVTAS